MRFPVFSRGSNPRIDRPILRKKLDYVEKQVEDRLADWIDPADPSKGIIAREFLPSGKAVPAAVSGEALAAEIAKLSKTLKSGLPPVEVGGCKFVPPAMAKNDSLARPIVENVAIAAQAWDWSKEPRAVPA